MKLRDFKNYSGDVNLEHGGTFFDFSEWKYDYVPALRITDLDSACGFTGAVMVERLTVIVPDSKDRLESILSAIGEDDRTDELWQQLENGCKLETEHNGVGHNDRMLIAYASLAYGLYDPVSDMSGPHRWIIQTESIPWVDTITDAIKDAKSDLDRLEDKLIDAINEEVSGIEYLETVDSLIEDHCLLIYDSIVSHLEYTVENAPMEYDGWKADVQLDDDTTLFEYLLESGYLSEYE